MNFSFPSTLTETRLRVQFMLPDTVLRSVVTPLSPLSFLVCFIYQSGWFVS
jgi:hypothetical protein